MADPMVVAQMSADAMLKIRANAAELADVLGIDPPAAIAPEAMKEPCLREARLKESLADFFGRAIVAAQKLNPSKASSSGDAKENDHVEEDPSERRGDGRTAGVGEDRDEPAGRPVQRAGRRAAGAGRS